MPSSRGARVVFSGDQRTVIDGPFAETKELVAGYWIWEVKSLAEAIEWAKRCPNPHPGGGTLEIRPFFAEGQWVRIKEGPFEGVTGIVVERRNKRRVLVGLAAIGQGLEIDIDARLLKAISSP